MLRLGVDRRQVSQPEEITNTPQLPRGIFSEVFEEKDEHLSCIQETAVAFELFGVEALRHQGAGIRSQRPFEADGVPTGPAAAPSQSTPEDDDIDLDELVDAPPETVKTPIDRLAEAFPGSELVDERD